MSPDRAYGVIESLTLRDEFIDLFDENVLTGGRYISGTPMVETRSYNGMECRCSTPFYNEMTHKRHC